MSRKSVSNARSINKHGKISAAALIPAKWHTTINVRAVTTPTKESASAWPSSNPAPRPATSSDVEKQGSATITRAHSGEVRDAQGCRPLGAILAKRGRSTERGQTTTRPWSGFRPLGIGSNRACALEVVHQGARLPRSRSDLLCKGRSKARLALSPDCRPAGLSLLTDEGEV